MTTYVGGGATDKTHDVIVTVTTEPPASQNTNTVTHQINAGTAVMVQSASQAQPTLERVRDFRG
jgi:hypothetical protein